MKPAAIYIIGQAIALGLLGAFLIIPGSAVFLHAFGADRLPYVYLTVAVAGAVTSYGITALQSRFGLYQLAVTTTLGAALVIGAGWVALMAAGVESVGFVFLVVFALQLQLGFVFIGAQAGRAFDVQEIKRVFSRIVAGFVFGFMVGGFAATGFDAVGGAAENLLAASALSAAVMAALMLGASRHVGEPVDAESHADDDAGEAAPTLRQVLRIPLVAAVFAYQVLSAMGTQMLEYLLYDRAAARFQGTQEVASFMGQYSAVLNLVDLVVLVALGGFLMSRFGLRFGLAANPVIVTGLTAVAAVVAMVAGPDVTVFFLLIAVARIADLTMADAATRTSVNATFKALPPRMRLAAQVGVEGAGVPIALGLTALLILAINAVPGTGVIHHVIATLILCALWSAAAWVVYRRYKTAVVVAVRRRTLDGDGVDLDEPDVRAALQGLLGSDDPGAVSIAAGLVLEAGYPDGEDLVRRAGEHSSLDVQRAVLSHLIERDPDAARTIAVRCVESGEREHVLDGIRALGRLPDRLDITVVRSFLDSDDLALKSAAMGAVLRNSSTAQEVADRVGELVASDDPEKRAFAATVIAEAGTAPSLGQVAGLLGDADNNVRSAAQAAVSRLDDAARVELLEITSNNAERDRILRACRRSASPAFCALLAEALSKQDEVSPELVRLLNASEWQAGDEHLEAITCLIEAEIVRIETASSWIEQTSAKNGMGDTAVSRLERALAQEANASGLRLMNLLGLIYDRRLVDRVGRVLRGTAVGDPGLALESLDLSLAPQHRGPVLKALQAAFSIGDTPAGNSAEDAPFDEASLRALAERCDWAAQPDWLLACALDLLRSRGGSIAGITPRGPVSAELLVEQSA